MTISEVEDRLALLRQIAGDPEAAHGEEDSLYGDVLNAIATGEAEDAVEMARLVLTSEDIDFARWYA